MRLKEALCNSLYTVAAQASVRWCKTGSLTRPERTYRDSLLQGPDRRDRCGRKATIRQRLPLQDARQQPLTLLPSNEVPALYPGPNAAACITRSPSELHRRVFSETCQAAITTPRRRRLHLSLSPLPCHSFSPPASIETQSERTKYCTVSSSHKFGYSNQLVIRCRHPTVSRTALISPQYTYAVTHNAIGIQCMSPPPLVNWRI